MCHDTTSSQQPTNAVRVNVRVEGKTKTHPCNGLNNHGKPPPGPTCTGALDDASKSHFSWDATFSKEFDDFFIKTIAGETNTSQMAWIIYLNYKSINVGGCQQKVNAGDQILFAFVNFSAPVPALHLTGPHATVVGKEITVHVADGDGKPIAGATVHGHTTDEHGNARITFNRPGKYDLKAEKTGTIRSNTLIVEVGPGP
ncbi:hypothetical protein AMATHDRAFT_71913 [Amanita thiersii Skay4041]|uniref:Transcobalamin-like C-terminal domain-containing protein n=1 Tax=Amanita thiersii Skay4041 TaxID=703135 RepID=A0A2A9N651_9AGAR|nr:hypothetical protein AMATHDRAFT_71913 [Amanita thiersii Skay4041]